MHPNKPGQARQRHGVVPLDGLRQPALFVPVTFRATEAMLRAAKDPPPADSSEPGTGGTENDGTAR